MTTKKNNREDEVFTEENRYGALLEDMNSKLDIVVDGVASLDRRVSHLENDMVEVKDKLGSIEAVLVGKADAAKMELLERRVEQLEKAVLGA